MDLIDCRISALSVYGSARDLRNARRLAALYTFAVARTDAYSLIYAATLTPNDVDTSDLKIEFIETQL